MMPKKSPVSHTILAHSKQHLQEHRCGASRIPSEGQVRTSHNSRVLERGKLCVPWFVRVLGLLQQYRVDHSSLDQKSFPYRSLLGRILQDPFLIEILLSSIKHGEQDISLYTKSQVARKPVSMSSALPYLSTLQWCQLNTISLLKASALKRASWTPFSAYNRSLFADHCQWKPTVSLVAISLCLTTLSAIFILIKTYDPCPWRHVSAELNALEKRAANVLSSLRCTNSPQNF